MAKRDRKLKKRKEREAKVKRKKLRLQEERRAAEKAGRVETLPFEEEVFYAEEDEPDADFEYETDSEYETERFDRYFRKQALKLGYDPDALEPEHEEEVSSDWKAKREALLHEDPEELAQEFAFGAMESVDEDEWDEAEYLAGEALRLDPRNVDALTHMANAAFDRSEEEGFRRLRETVSLARSALGGDAFLDAHRGRLGSVLAARPYLRARASLASHLHLAGRMEEAMQEYAGLAELDAEENKPYALILLDCYLLLGKLAEARNLLDTRKDKTAPAILWGRVLVEFLSGNLEAAEQAWRIARPVGKRFAEFLIKEQGAFAEAEYDEEHDEEHDEDDAARSMHLLAVQGRSWYRNPAALEWLRSRYGLTPVVPGGNAEAI